MSDLMRAAVGQAALDYLERHERNAVYPDCGSGNLVALNYCALGLGESGEFQGKLKKVWRGDRTLDEAKEALRDELVDVQWYVLAAAKELGMSFQDLLERGSQKMDRRHAAGTIKGDGDDR